MLFLRNRKLVIISIILLFLIIVIVLGYFYNKNKARQEKIGDIQSSLPQDYQRLSTPVDTSGVKTTQEGIYSYASLRGKLMKIEEKDGQFFFVIDINNNDKNLTISVNLGEKNFIVAENTQTHDETGIVLTNSFTNSTAETLANKYQSLVGKNISIRVLYLYKGDVPEGCDDICKKRIVLINNYSSNNVYLDKLQDFPNDRLEVGLGVLVGEYPLLQ